MLGNLFARKLSGRSKIQLAVASVCAALAFLLVQGYASSIAASDPGGLVEVVTATRGLARGTTLRTSDVALAREPANFLPPGALRSAQDAIGQALSSDVAAGEVLTEQRLTRAAGPVAALVPQGLRAIVVATDLPEGILSPGDEVDLVATYGGGQPWSETVATEIEILDVLTPESGVITDGPGGIRLVLLVDATAAQDIAHAKAFAKIEAVIVGAAGAPVASQPGG